MHCAEACLTEERKNIGTYIPTFCEMCTVHIYIRTYLTAIQSEIEIATEYVIVDEIELVWGEADSDRLKRPLHARAKYYSYT